jgi:hypothetical protein
MLSNPKNPPEKIFFLEMNQIESRRKKKKANRGEILKRQHTH